MLGMLHPTRRKNEGKNLARKHLRGGYKHGLHVFQGGQDIMDALVHLRKKKGAGRGEATTGESVLATLLWGMLYADDARAVSQSPDQLTKIVGVVVAVCAAFGLTVSEAKTEIMSLRTKGGRSPPPQSA